MRSHIPANLAIWLVMAAGIILRLLHLGSESLWIDEGYSLRDAANSSAWSGVRPLYFCLLRLWMQFGESELWLRLPAVIFGMAAVWVVYITGRRLFGYKTGVLSSLFTAVSPLQINHSQEIRMYSLVTLLATLEVLFFAKYIERQKARDLFLCMISAGLAFAAHPLTIYLLAALNIFLLLQVRRFRSAAALWFASQGAAAMAAIPSAPGLLRASRDFGDAWVAGMAKPGAVDFLRLLRDFNLWQIPARHHAAAVAGDIYGLFVILVAVYGGLLAWKNARWQTSLILLWLIVPALFCAATSYLLVNVWLGRYLIYAAPAFYILTAIGIAAVQKRAAATLLLLAVLSLPAARLGIYYLRPHRPEWNRAVRYVNAHELPGDSVAVYRYGYRHVFSYYYKGRAPYVILGPNSLNSGVVSRWLETGLQKEVSGLDGGRGRIWFLVSCNENTGEEHVDRCIRRTYPLIYVRSYKCVRVYLADAARSPRPEQSRNPANR